MPKRITSESRPVVYLLCASLLAGGTDQAGGSGKVSRRLKQEAAQITTAALREDLSYIASDELSGRDTPSPGLEKAAAYIEQHLKEWGIEPAGEKGTYRQTLPLQMYGRDVSATSARLGGRNLTLAKDFITPENPILAGSASGNLVYVGSGFIVKAKGVNPYTSIDVKGKIIVCTGLLPPGLKLTDLQGQPGNDYYFPPQAAKLNGAVGVVAILSEEQLKQFPAPPNLAELLAHLSLRDGRKEDEPWLPTLLPSEALVREMFQGERMDGAGLLSALRNGKWPEPFNLVLTRFSASTTVWSGARRAVLTSWAKSLGLILR